MAVKQCINTNRNVYIPAAALMLSLHYIFATQSQLTRYTFQILYHQLIKLPRRITSLPLVQQDYQKFLQARNTHPNPSQLQSNSRPPTTNMSSPVAVSAGQASGAAQAPVPASAPASPHASEHASNATNEPANNEYEADSVIDEEIRGVMNNPASTTAQLHAALRSLADELRALQAELAERIRDLNDDLENADARRRAAEEAHDRSRRLREHIQRDNRALRDQNRRAWLAVEHNMRVDFNVTGGHVTIGAEALEGRVTVNVSGGTCVIGRARGREEVDADEEDDMPLAQRRRR